jgi:glutathione S-transferase
MFMRLWFLDHDEGRTLPDGECFARIRRFRDACLAHPAVQQTSCEEIVQLHDDYAKGAGNGGLALGGTRSSSALTPHWRQRPWPPADEHAQSATDAELGLRASRAFDAGGVWITA